MTIHNEKVLLRDGEVLDIDGIKIECFLVPGHTWGHMVYLIDDNYLFTGDTICSAQTADTASSPRWPRTTSSRCVRSRRWRKSCVRAV